MNTQVKMTTLLDSVEKEDLMINMLQLKIATKVIENENSHTIPYGGANFIEEVLFQTKLTVRCLWDDFFMKKGIDYKNNKTRFRSKMEHFHQIRPDLKIKYS